MSLLAYEFRPRLVKSFFQIFKRELLLNSYFMLILCAIQISLFVFFNLKLGKYNYLIIFQNIVTLISSLSIYFFSILRDIKNGFIKALKLAGINIKTILVAKWCASFVIFISMHISYSFYYLDNAEFITLFTLFISLLFIPFISILFFSEYISSSLGIILINILFLCYFL